MGPVELTTGRRVARVEVSGEVLEGLCFAGPPDQWCRCSAGLPDGAKCVGMWYDAGRNLLCMNFEHPSFPLTAACLPIPRADPPMWESIHDVTYDRDAGQFVVRSYRPGDVRIETPDGTYTPVPPGTLLPPPMTAAQAAELRAALADAKPGTMVMLLRAAESPAEVARLRDALRAVGAMLAIPSATTAGDVLRVNTPDIRHFIAEQLSAHERAVDCGLSGCYAEEAVRRETTLFDAPEPPAAHHGATLVGRALREAAAAERAAILATLRVLFERSPTYDRQWGIRDAIEVVEARDRPPADTPADAPEVAARGAVTPPPEFTPVVLEAKTIPYNGPPSPYVDALADAAAFHAAMDAKYAELVRQEAAELDRQLAGDDADAPHVREG